MLHRNLCVEAASGVGLGCVIARWRVSASLWSSGCSILRPFRAYFSDFDVEASVLRARASSRDQDRAARLRWGVLSPHRGDQRLDAHDVQHAREIIGEHMQCHLGCDLR